VVDASLSPAGPRSGFGPTERRRAAVLAGSIVFHIAILTPLALRFFEPPVPIATPALEDPVFLQMEPRPLLRGETARAALAAATRDEVTSVTGQPRSGEAAPTVMKARADALPSRPVPQIAANTPQPDAPAIEDSWRLRPESRRAAVARSLRTGPVGCRMMDGRLSPGEQQLCDDRFNEAAAGAGPLGPRTLTPSEARREAQFAQDGANALAQYEGRRTRRSGVGVVGSSPECVGGNLRGTCAGANLRPEFQHPEDAPFGGSAGPR
jgi:hypothetical protein